MSDTIMTIAGFFLAAILMFVFPIMEIAGKNDEMSQTLTQIVVTDFVDTVATKGKITKNDYDVLIQKLYATENSFDIEFEIQIVDDNPRRIATTTNKNQSGEYRYYSVYTDSVMAKLDNNEDYLLKKDDRIIVNVKNSNITIATQLKNMFYKLIGSNTYTIGTSATALIVNTGR